MTNLWANILELLSNLPFAALLRAITLLLLGWLLARFAALSLARAFAKRLSPQQLMLLRRIGFYGVLVLFAVSALRELGFNFAVLLGAAGIVTVAIGFASQTSASNLISGLFLVVEQAVEVGNIIKVGQTTGEVISIDLLSTKLRTFDNLLVRIPNETMVKTEIINYSSFPIRRLDIQIGVAYKEDISKVQEILFDVSDNNPLCLEEPAPLLIFLGFGDSALNLQFSVWMKKENFLELRNEIQRQIKEAFDAKGIEIPFPHRTLYVGSETTPFPVRVVSSREIDG